MKYTQVPKDPSMEEKICEICGKTFPAGQGFSLASCWLVTGHPLVRAFGCQETETHPNGYTSLQHWGCSMEHAVQATVECLQTHMIDQLKQKHMEADKQQS